MAAQKFTNFDKCFFNAADMTAFMMQFNKIVSNEVKNSLSTTRAIVWKKLNQLFGQPNMYLI